ncbi:uncharacterized protein MONOS_1849 [Monocercomonoides exilis]|uniref:uncharacterized protein n=1 Tax=Monocercomonoides exilis TaxID=2049356 RepID=UPI00355A738C|nr:hypothetical protein MONOS_1849 [Monocercomonoides exilis]|eukprot:MONOS_1849.1-p1 / transcript=MONOS_1849.1 / gene=MONOS_1849 / organism=Monocercomonoides_exilis_PA203 / gene_product=unspecified product / transcript_product=unspecified product / location=Mono_scaffold00035:28355-29800(+) / protein_length=438 / sequence_SO=supercontig / SO=protein_coding / is_pseudo=false
MPCSCKGGCNSGRCKCFKNSLKCSVDCRCENCSNMGSNISIAEISGFSGIESSDNPKGNDNAKEKLDEATDFPQVFFRKRHTRKLLPKKSIITEMSVTEPIEIDKEEMEASFDAVYALQSSSFYSEPIIGEKDDLVFQNPIAEAENSESIKESSSLIGIEQMQQTEQRKELSDIRYVAEKQSESDLFEKEFTQKNSDKSESESGCVHKLTQKINELAKKLEFQKEFCARIAQLRVAQLSVVMAIKEKFQETLSGLSRKERKMKVREYHLLKKQIELSSTALVMPSEHGPKCVASLPPLPPSLDSKNMEIDAHFHLLSANVKGRARESKRRATRLSAIPRRMTRSAAKGMDLQNDGSEDGSDLEVVEAVFGGHDSDDDDERKRRKSILKMKENHEKEKEEDALDNVESFSEVNKKRKTRATFVGQKRRSTIKRRSTRK